MQIITKTILTLSIFTSIFLLNGCSSHHNDIITTIPIEGEQIVMLENENNYITDADPSFVLEDPSWTTELVLDPDAFAADEYVEKAPVITYKYKFDTKFYDTARWRSANE